MTASYRDPADQRNPRPVARDRWTIERAGCLIEHALFPRCAIDDGRQTMAQIKILPPRAGSNPAG